MAATRKDGREAGREDRAWLQAQGRASRPFTLPVAALGLGGTALAIVQAWCIAQLIGPILAGAAVARPWVWAAAFALAGLGRAGLALGADRRAFEAGAMARRRLRTAFLVAAFAAGPHRVGPGGVTAAVDQVEALDGYFARWIAAAALAVAGPVLVVLAVLPVDPVAAAIMAGGGLFVPVGMAVAGIGAAAASARQFASLARLQSRFLDRVRGIATIVLANGAEAEAERLRLAARDLRRSTVRVLRVAFLSSAVLDAAAATVLIVLALRAGAAWRAGTLDVTGAVFTLVLVAEFFAPFRAFSAAYQDRIHAAAAAASLRPAPGTEPATAAPPPDVRTVTANGVTVAFEDVGYTWDPSRGPALRHVSFRVPPNEMAVLVGPSGAGKSTVLELLLGFIRPDSGRITLNGADLLSITPAALSRMTAWIGQRPVLFAGTVRDNIRFGREDASDDAVAAAARSAGLEAVAAILPQGLDTPIGEGGYGLSGGQAQRVAIARAFLRQAPLLLLDEPTAHLDPATEADVLDSLRRLAIGRTVIMTAHSAAARALGGRIIALDEGRLATAAKGVA